MTSQNGRFITFEGGEGAGKSTQIRRLERALAGHFEEIVVTREPGGSQQAEIIRQAILSGSVRNLGAISEMMLFNAARAYHLADVIRPALARGAWVLCDRFSDSTRAYQGAAGGVSFELIDAVQAAIVGPTTPDLTLILDIPVERSLERVKSRGGPPDRYESSALQFHRDLREEFLSLAELGGRYVRIDGDQDADAVARDIRSCVSHRFALSAVKV